MSAQAVAHSPTTLDSSPVRLAPFGESVLDESLREIADPSRRVRGQDRDLEPHWIAAIDAATD
jgi:hypothetical protein